MSGQTIIIFGAIFNISLPLNSKNKVIRQIAAFDDLFSLFGGYLFYHNIMSIITCKTHYVVSMASHFNI
jgi:hypothetical protein